jgi:hypothetical protein
MPPIARGVASGVVIGVVAADHEPISTSRRARRLASAGSGEPLKASLTTAGSQHAATFPGARAVDNWGKPYMHWRTAPQLVRLTELNRSLELFPT